MAEVKIETVEKYTDSILEKVGKEPYINWEAFSQSSTEVARNIDELNSALAAFREVQHKQFIQTMRKLKSLDVPDLLQAVKNKKLPKEALRGVLGRFKLQGDNLDLIESADQLKKNAQKEFEEYVAKNKQFAEQLSNFTAYINKKALESGLLPSKQQQAVEQPRELKSTVKLNLSEETATKIASGIKIQYITGTKFIGYETYTQIVSGTFPVVKEEYERITRESRKIQRQNLKDSKEYLRIMQEYLMNSEALVAEGQALLARKVGITEANLGESEIALMERGLGNNLLMVQSQLRGQLKQCLTAQKDVTLEVAKEIIKYQVSLIEEKATEINSILNGLEKGPEALQLVPMVLTLILNDYVFQKYGYEEEDFMKNLGEEVLTTNPEFMKIFRDMEMGIMKLMQNLDVIPPEVADIMKQQQAMMQQMSGAGLMGAPPGVMPGQVPPMMPGLGASTNPMDMLQAQQLQQMQAMFSQMGLQPPK